MLPFYISKHSQLHRNEDCLTNRNTIPAQERRPPCLRKTANLGDPQGSQLKPHRSQLPAKSSKCKTFSNCGNLFDLERGYIGNKQSSLMETI